MKPLFGFGLSQEDERSERAILGLPGGRVLSVTSAGDMALSLLAYGADRVVAVDIDPNQNQLARLKLAAVLRLPRTDAIRFLGFLPAGVDQRRAWFATVLDGLGAPSRAFWQDHADAALRGAVWAGRYERFIRRVLAALRPWLAPRFRALFACTTFEEQRRVFDRLFDRPFVRGVFRVAFDPGVFAHRGIDPHGLRYHDPTVPLGEQYFRRFRAMCLNNPVRENWLLQLQTLGQVVSEDSVPTYLTVEGVAAVRAHHEQISFATADITTYLELSAPGSFDRFHLSNVTDWLDQASFEELMCKIAAKAARPARLAWRFIHVDRALPDDLRDVIRPDHAWGRELVAADRFPISSVVPATIDAGVVGGAG